MTLRSFAPVLLGLFVVVAPARAALPAGDPPDLRIPCTGGPWDVGVGVVLDFGRSIGNVNPGSPGGSGFVPAPSDFDALGSRDVAHLVGGSYFDLVTGSSCPESPAILLLGQRACLCVREDVSACEVTGRRGSGIPDVYTCPPSAADCCTGADDGMRLLSCRDLSATEGVIEVDVEIRYQAANAQHPHLYLGNVALDGASDPAHQWMRLESDQGHLPVGRFEPPGQGRRLHLPDTQAPGQFYPPGKRYPRVAEMRMIETTLRVLPSVQHYVQATAVEGTPHQVGTPPQGLLDRGETESYLILAELIPGGIQVSLLADGPGSVLLSCSN